MTYNEPRLHASGASQNPITTDHNHITTLEQALRLASYQPGEIFNLARISDEGIQSARFPLDEDGLDSAEKWIDQQADQLRAGPNSEKGGFYLGSNPVKSLAGGKASADEVTVLRTLLVDIDPTSDNDVGQLDARRVAEGLSRFLKESFSVRPPMIDSGRGTQIWVQHESLDNTEAHQGVRTALLRLIQDQFQCEETRIDSTANPDRLMRLLGTVNLRTGREASVLDEGDGVEIPFAKIQGLVEAHAQEQERSRPSGSTSNGPTDPNRVRDALQWIPADERQVWLNVGMALHDWGHSEGRSIWDEWSRASSKFDAADQERTWNSFESSGGITLGTLFDLAKKGGWRQAPAEEFEREQGRDQINRLIAIASGNAKLFHNSLQEGYAAVRREEHQEVWRIRSRGFELWLRAQFFCDCGSAPSSQALGDAIAQLEARALFKGAEAEVYVRVARVGDCVYLDLADDHWRQIKITPERWDLIPASQGVFFRRPQGLLALPEPVQGGSVEELRVFLNLPDGDEAWFLLAGWLLAALGGKGPFPILVLQGEQGTAKSTLTTIVRSIVDPHRAALRAPPKEERDLVIAANNGWVLAFDNWSGMKPWLADALCRLATGGAFSARKLYTDADEQLFEVSRPMIVNGIDDLATRGDVADRAIVLNLPRIPPEKRKPGGNLLAEFEKVRPRILGALLDALSHALRGLDQVQLDRYPRMADAVRLVTAGEEALGISPGGFAQAYESNRASGHAQSLDDPVAEAVDLLVPSPGDQWRGSATEFLVEVQTRWPDLAQRGNWPKSASTLSNRLTRLVGALRSRGIDFTRTHSGWRKIILRRMEDDTADGQGKDNAVHAVHASKKTAIPYAEECYEDSNWTASSTGAESPSTAPSSVSHSHVEVVDGVDALDGDSQTSGSEGGSYDAGWRPLCSPKPCVVCRQDCGLSDPDGRPRCLTCSTSDIGEVVSG